jgi:arylsulfatase
LFLSAGRLAAKPGRPNIVVILADNLGDGELGCYGGFRMVPTPRIDRLAAEGLRLTNFNVEVWCAPSRSALLTGRYGVRSGTDRMISGVQGMVQWETTLAELLSDQGYTSALYGKWHLGEREGRLPNDQGFDEWFGITSSWMPTPMHYLMDGVKGQRSRSGVLFDPTVGQTIDRQITERSIAFIQRNAKARRPFFLYVPISAVHLPVYCPPELAGKSGAGLIGDAILGMDHNVGRIVDAVDKAGVSENTIFIFASDNGPEFQDPFRGTAGPWSGYYNTAMEGSLRAPCIIRWPGHVPRGRTSNEIVHITDLFTTLARAAGASIPTDRTIDGVDEMDFFTGQQEKSNREGFPVFVFGKLYAVKWQNWKMHLVWRPDPTDRAVNEKRLFNLRSDPKEEYNVLAAHPSVEEQAQRVIDAFNATLVSDPLIKPGTDDPYRPPQP